MFEDFDQNAATGEGRKRVGVSVALSLLIFLGAAGALAAAIATTHSVIARRAPDVAVEFAAIQAPPPQPEVTPTEPVARKRAKKRSTGRKRNQRPPKEIPTDAPEEAEGDLADAGETGPTDGFEDGDPNGTEIEADEAPSRPEPRQVRDSILRPRFVSGCRAPAIPEALRGQAATIEVDIRMLVGADGSVLNAQVIQSHPLIPDELILRCAQDQRFEPAQLSDGTPVPYPFRRRFIFRPAHV